MAAILLAVALFAGAAVQVVVTATPAHALHQHCGEGLPGTGSLSNGHPDLTSPVSAWSGVGQIQELEDALQGVGYARVILNSTLSILDSVADLLEEIATTKIVLVPALAVGTPVSQIYLSTTYTPFITAATVLKIIGTVISVVDLLLIITETVLLTVQRDVNNRVAEADACGGTLMGDTLHMTWVAMVQRNLASSGPPLAILMTPSRPALASNAPEFPLLPATQKSDFSWCPEIPASIRGELPASGSVALSATGGDCASTVQQGFLDVPDLGVADITNKTLKHLASHGIDVRDATTIAGQADTALQQKKYSDAFHLYRQAYQNAMGLTTS